MRAPANPTPAVGVDTNRSIAIHRLLGQRRRARGVMVGSLRLGHTSWAYARAQGSPGGARGIGNVAGAMLGGLLPASARVSNRATAASHRGASRSNSATYAPSVLIAVCAETFGLMGGMAKRACEAKIVGGSSRRLLSRPRSVEQHRPHGVRTLTLHCFHHARAGAEHFSAMRDPRSGLHRFLRGRRLATQLLAYRSSTSLSFLALLPMRQSSRIFRGRARGAHLRLRGDISRS